MIERSDVLELLDAALAADYTRVKRAGGRIAQSLVGEDPATAKEMRALIRRKGVPLRTSGYAETLPVDTKSRLPLVEEQPWPTSPLFLSGGAASTFDAFIEDVKNGDLLSQSGVSTRLGMLISGPPGTGKTLLAGHVAARLERPLYVVRLDSVVSSLLGDTAKNVRSVFDYVPTRDGILFLDEMDAVAKLRDDRHELGELKRVVNTVIQSLDALDDRAIVIGATNHAQLLDPAIWRRFPYRIEFGLPDASVRLDLWRYFLHADIPHSYSEDILTAVSDGMSGADIQNLALAARRQAILDGRPIDIPALTFAVLENRSGHLATLERHGLTTDQKKSLSQSLISDFDFSGADAARLLGITRQAVAAYLKEDRNADR